MVNKNQSSEVVTASAPYPHELFDLVSRMRAYPGWEFKLQYGKYDDGSVEQLRLIIYVHHHNSYHPKMCSYCGGVVPSRTTGFHYPVPMVTFNRDSWQRWLRDRVADVHVHEDGEAIAFEYETAEVPPTFGWPVESMLNLGLGRRDNSPKPVRYLVRPFAPFHGPGRDPNRLVEVGVDPMEQRILQDGSVCNGSWITSSGHIHDEDEHNSCSWYAPCIPINIIQD